MDDPQLWLERHGDALYGYAWSRVGDPQMAEDVVQETLLSAWRARDTFRGESSRRTWLIAILRRKILDARRKAAREVPLPVVDGPTWFGGRRQCWQIWPGEWGGNSKGGSGENFGGDPGDLAEREDLFRVLRACIDDLPRDQAEAIKRRSLKGDTVEVCCKAMAISASNLAVRLYRARLALRRCLEVRWFSPDDE